MACFSNTSQSIRIAMFDARGILVKQRNSSSILSKHIKYSLFYYDTTGRSHLPDSHRRLWLLVKSFAKTFRWVARNIYNLKIFTLFKLLFDRSTESCSARITQSWWPFLFSNIRYCNSKMFIKESSHQSFGCTTRFSAQSTGAGLWSHQQCEI